MHSYRKCWFDLFKEQFISHLNFGQNCFAQLRWNWFSVRLPVTYAWNCHSLCTAFSSILERGYVSLLTLSFMFASLTRLNNNRKVIWIGNLHHSVTLTSHSSLFIWSVCFWHVSSFRRYACYVIVYRVYACMTRSLKIHTDCVKHISFANLILFSFGAIFSSFHDFFPNLSVLIFLDG